MQVTCIWKQMKAVLEVAFATVMFLGLSLLANATEVSVDCSGQTAGAFTRIQAAIDSLDLIGPHQVTVASQPCTENIHIVDRQRLTIIAPKGGAFISSAAGAAENTINISGSTGIQLILLGVQDGLNGIRIARNSEVQVLGCTIQNNAFNGIQAVENSTVSMVAAVQGNGNSGIVLDESTITVRSSQIQNNAAVGLILRGSRARILGGEGVNLFEGNRIGINVVHHSSADFGAPNSIQNNRVAGVQVSEASAARFNGDVDSNGTPLPNVISGNGLIGVNITGGQVSMFGANEVNNNGFSGQPFRAGVRVDDNGSLVAVGSGNITISNNTGPGIDATTGGNVDLTGTLVNNNRGDGIHALANSHIAFFPPNTNVVAGNGGKAINCDASSVFLGDRTGVAIIGCPISPLSGLVSPSRRQLADTGP